VKNTPWGSSYKPAPEILHGEIVKLLSIACTPSSHPPSQGGAVHASKCSTGAQHSCVARAGYTMKVTGRTAEERLDMRAAQKSDKFCK
jgi:hypothetical protein